MSGDPMWFFFVIPIILIALQLLVLSIILCYSNKLKAWWKAHTNATNYEDCYLLPTASEIRAKNKQNREEQTLHTKEKLLKQGEHHD